MQTPFHKEGGFSLIEALVAVLVLSLSLMAALRLQTWLRLHGDLARERSDAVRLAQQDMEHLRAFEDLAALGRVTSGHAQAASPTTTFTVQRRVAADDLLTTSVATVSWPQRGNGEQQVALMSSVARLSPVYSAALALPPQDHVLASRRPLPFGARTLLDGRIVFKPSRLGTVAWLLDTSTGDITTQCQVTPSLDPRALRSADLSQCALFTARLVRGYIRFSLSSPPDPLQANDTPLPLSVQAGESRCEIDAITHGEERYLAYACATRAGSPPPAVQLAPQGWAFGLTASTFRACRYGAAPLMPTPSPQNYLVIRGDLACPSAVPPHNGEPVVTVQQQP
ncbi:MAG: prepilin-type N-terminal cleavage/methylation domain-containing protein [Rhizobacter sp.]|nr:prepilin-type N-terminal cleavage/methylation domain-containing protein [Rhizobacter sp.]